MVSRITFPTLALVLLSPSEGLGACVSNATDQPQLFIIDAKIEGLRASGIVAPGEELCLNESTGAIFHVFASSEELEGCSRLVGPGGDDVLVEFQRYDNCRWGSHDR